MSISIKPGRLVVLKTPDKEFIFVSRQEDEGKSNG